MKMLELSAKDPKCCEITSKAVMRPSMTAFCLLCVLWDQLKGQTESGRCKCPPLTGRILDWERPRHPQALDSHTHQLDRQCLACLHRADFRGRSQRCLCLHTCSPTCQHFCFFDRS